MQFWTKLLLLFLFLDIEIVQLLCKVATSIKLWYKLLI